MWVFASISEYLLPLQIPTGKYLLRSLVFATVCSFVGCNGVYKVVFFPPKDWSNETLFDQTRKGI